MMAKDVLIVCVVLLGILRPCHAAEDCPVAGIVVGSVFGTLAVCALVIGIIAFLLWKRRKGLSKSPHTPLKSKDGDTPTKDGFDNPAFDQGERNNGDDVEAGVGGYVECKEFGQDQKKKSPFTSQMDREFIKKTWTSLPRSDIPGFNRSGSIGSLDRNAHAGDTECVLVDLQSQDFIGLGFNIMGSMRDGIFVSQVHNRGPAVESGKFRVGDRIMSVTISFENMVYEDALTILSYASPYPVKACLQKQEQAPKGRRLSDSKMNLNHPLFRSQSVDTLVKIGKEPAFNPQRSRSEMRHDKRDSPNLKRFKNVNALDKESVIEELTSAKSSDPSINSSDDDRFLSANNVSPRMNPLVTVHNVDPSVRTKLDFENEARLDTDAGLNATLDLNNTQVSKPTENGHGNLSAGVDMLDGKTTTPSGFPVEFENLTEQDRLDMIRLSYIDPDEGDLKKDKALGQTEQTVEVEINPTLVNGELKSAPAPSKPERKKKRSSATSNTSLSDGELTGSTPSSPGRRNDEDADSLDVVDDEMVFTMSPPAEAPPPPPPADDNDSDQEVQEESIAAASDLRILSLGTDKIAFKPVELKRNIDLTKEDDGHANISVSSVDLNTTLVDHELSDMDETLVRPPSPDNRSSSDEDPIEEEEIAPTLRKSEDIRIPVLPVMDDTVVRRSRSSSSSSSSSDGSSNDGEETPLEPGTHSEETADFDKDLPNLDMNLNFDTDSVLFKESFPSRNTKENDGGMAYDISVTELDAMESKAKKEEMAKLNKNQTPKGGIAYEIRDDVITGVPHTVTSTSVHRTSSYDLKTHTDNSSNLSQRSASFKDDNKFGDENSDLDWSGKRLVRSGSFSEIPQDDATNDWTDHTDVNDDEHALIEQHIQEDSQSPEMKQLTKATLFKGKDNMADISDSDQCRSISSSSSSSRSSPSREFTNGQDDGLGTSPESSPIKITQTSETKGDLVSTVTKYGDSNQAFTVTLQTSTEDNVAEC